MATSFAPAKPMRFPSASGPISQIDLYDALTDPRLDMSRVAAVVAPALEAAQQALQQDEPCPELDEIIELLDA